MALTTKTLFPPIVEHTMPAFLREGNCRLYFDLPVYNTIKDIQKVQFIINNQNNNLSALNDEKYPTGIKMVDCNLETVNGQTKYYIDLLAVDMEDASFALNQYYKVQLRFVGLGAKDVMTIGEKPNANWLAENQEAFSEWSSVCLIRGISTPQINIKGFNLEDPDQNVVIASQIIDFIGKLYFNESEIDCLEKYSIQLYEDTTSNELIADSGIIYTSIYAPNEINYTFKQELKDGNNYKAVFTYTTKARYTASIDFKFSIILYDIEKMKVNIVATPENEFGRIKINVKSLSGERFTGNLTIRRSDSRSNFTLWEDVYTDLVATGEILDFTWYDNTIECGIWYNYCVQKRNSRGDRGIVTKIERPVLCYFEDMFLIKEDKSVRIKYDQQVSSWKRNLIESKTDTIGGKYPFIRRNANTDYRQFQISGLITCFMDEGEDFTNPEELYGTSVKLYNDFNETNKIYKYNDFIYEREFRNKVLDFLHENDVILFKTLTEGNVLVRLMDINITPNTTLGRRIYSFSATAYEIEEPSVYNFTKYNIQNAGKINQFVQFSSTIMGQIGTSKTAFSANEEIVTKIKEKFAEQSDVGFENIVQSLNYLRIEIIPTLDSRTRLIDQSGGQTLSYVDSSKKINSSLKRGTIVNINGKDFIIDESNYYEVFNADIKSIKFPDFTCAIIDYGCDLEKKEAQANLANRFYYSHKTGQLHDCFEPNEYLTRTLRQRYELDTSTYYQRLTAINGITVWADPGTVIYIKDSLDYKFNRFIIGNDGVLEFNKENATIEDFYFKGVHITPKPESRDKPLRYEYRTLFDNETGEVPIFAPQNDKTGEEIAAEWTKKILEFQARKKIKAENPWLDDLEINKKVAYLKIKPELLNNTIYWIVPMGENIAKRYICLKGKLYPCPGPNVVEDVEIPVNAVIDYFIDLTRGEY